MTLRAKERVEACYTRAQQLAAENQFDYAHTLFAECVLGDPGSLEYAEGMLANLRAKCKGKKKKVGGRLKRTLQHAYQDKQWPHVFRLGVDVLASNPWHITTLCAIARACEARHQNETELVYLKEALDADPRNANVNRHCAKSLGRMGQFDQAIACWHRVEEVTGGDSEATLAITRLAEEKMKYPGGIPPAASISEANITQDNAEDGEDNNRHHQVLQVPSQTPLSRQQELLQLILSDPADVVNYLELANWYGDLDDYSKAERVLQKAHQSCVQTTTIDRAIEDIRARKEAFLREQAERIERERRRREKRQFRIPWLEIVLGSALLVLLMQMIPGAWDFTVSSATHHSQSILFVLNLAIVFGLFLWRLRSQT